MTESPAKIAEQTAQDLIRYSATANQIHDAVVSVEVLSRFYPDGRLQHVLDAINAVYDQLSVLSLQNAIAAIKAPAIECNNRLKPACADNASETSPSSAEYEFTLVANHSNADLEYIVIRVIRVANMCILRKMTGCIQGQSANMHVGALPCHHVIVDGGVVLHYCPDEPSHRLIIDFTSMIAYIYHGNIIAYVTKTSGRPVDGQKHMASMCNNV